MRHFKLCLFILSYFLFLPLHAEIWIPNSTCKIHTYLLTDPVNSEQVIITAHAREQYQTTTPIQWFKERLAKKKKEHNTFKTYKIEEYPGNNILLYSTMQGYYDQEHHKRLKLHYAFFHLDENKVSLFEIDLNHNMSVLERILTGALKVMKQFVHGQGPWLFEQNKDLTLYMPSDLDITSDERYAISLFKPTSLGKKSLKVWFQEKANNLKNIAQDAIFLKTPKKMDRLGEVTYTWYTAIIRYTDQTGVIMHKNVIGLPLPNNRVILYIFDYSNKNVLKRYKKAFNSLADSDELEKHLQTLRMAQEKKKRKEKERAALSLARWTAPNKGLKKSDIEGLLYHEKMIYDFYTARYYPRDYAYLLLKDGTAYKNPIIPPSDFNIEASRKFEPNRWYFWKKSNNRFIMKANKDSEWRSISGSLVSTTKPDKKHIDAHLSVTSHWGGGAVTIASGSSTSSLSLYKNGRFTTSKSNSFSGGTYPGSLSQLSGHTKSDEKGTSSSFLGTGSSLDSYGQAHQTTVIANNKKKKGKNAHRQGEYTIDGNTIEFRYDSGKVAREIFFYTSNISIYVSGTNYSIK
jgi:hypothetical protein